MARRVCPTNEVSMVARPVASVTFTWKAAILRSDRVRSDLGSVPKRLDTISRVRHHAGLQPLARVRPLPLIRERAPHSVDRGAEETSFERTQP